VILKKLPMVLSAGTLIPLLVSVFSRFSPLDGTAAQVAKYIANVDVLTIAVLMTLWLSVLTVPIGCVMVVIMKGATCIADAYPLIDSEHRKSNEAVEHESETGRLD
jgi:hypothetical protein